MIGKIEIKKDKPKRIRSSVLSGIAIALFGLAFPLVALVFAIFSFYRLLTICDGYAYSGAVAGSLAICFAGVTQLIIYLRNRQKSIIESYDQVKHDYTNFFVKNCKKNNILYSLLKKLNANFELELFVTENRINLTFNGSKVTGGSSSIVLDDNNWLEHLRSSYLSTSIDYLLDNKNGLRSYLEDNYKINLSSFNDTSDYLETLSEDFSTEVMKAFRSMQKMYENRFQGNYFKDFYDQHVSKELNEFAVTFLPFYYLLVYTKNSKITKPTDRSLTYMLYYLQEKRSN